MPKADFNNSNAVRMFGNSTYSRQLLTSIVNNEKVVGVNPAWFLTQGSINPTLTPMDEHGLATFTVYERSLDADPLASLRAPLGDAETMDFAGVNSYAASIPDFNTRKFVISAPMRKDWERSFAMLGSDAAILKEMWGPNVQRQIRQMQSTMNWMTAQLMTTGKIVYGKIGSDRVGGIYSPIHKADIPAANFVKAGSVAWTDPSAKIITCMQTIEGNFRERTAYDGAMVWQFTKKFFLNVFIKNAEVLEKVNEFRNLQDLISVTFNNINTDVFNNAWENVRAAYGLSRIEIVEEKEFVENKETGEMKAVNGWADNIAVLRPAGDAVRFMRKGILDEEYADMLNSATQRNFAPIYNGLGTLVNSTVAEGIYNSWQTVVLFSAVPALVEFTHHVIVDTSQAG